MVQTAVPHVQAAESTAVATAAALAGRQQSLRQQWGLPHWHGLAVGNSAGHLRIPVHLDTSPGFLVNLTLIPFFF